jgi:acyl carrier protein/NADP-dependent 3-hydroxy acid dehydrogenase YdfG
MGALQEHFATTTTAGPEQLAELRTLADIVTFVADASTGTAPTAPAPAAPTTAAGPDADTVRTVLLDIVADKTGYPADMLDPTMDIEADLGIDSIKRVEIMGALQEHFATTTAAGPEQLAELRTLADIVDFVAGVPRVAGRESVAGGAEAQGASSGEDHPPEPVSAVHPAQASDRAARIGRAHAALVELSLPDPLLDAYAPDHGALVVDDGSQLAAHLVERLTGTGRRVHTLRLPGVPARSSDVSAHPLTGWGTTELAAQIEEIFTDRIALVVDVTAEHRAEWAEGTRRLAHSLLLARHVVGPLSAAAEHGRAGFLTVTRLDGAFGLTGVAEEQVPAGGVAGLVKTLALEAPALFCRAVDLSPALDAATGAALLLDEAADSAVEPVQVGLDGTRRVGLTAGGEPLAGTDPKGLADAEVPAPSSEDVLVVTGGARGITATCVVELARRYRPELLLLGRTPLAEEPEWARGVPDAGLKAAAAAALTAAGEKPTPKKVGRLAADVAGSREIRGTLDALRAAGSRAEYLAVDITDQSATAAVLAPYRDRITGLVHGAGVLADQLIAHKKASEIERVFAPKLTGLRSLTAVLPAERLRHVVLFSSVAGFFGNQGQSDYAMANEVLNAWAASARRRLPHARVTSLNWGAWDSGMVSPQIKAVFEERGIPLIQAADGARLFAEQFAPERAADTVTVLGPTTPLSSRERPAVTAPATVRRSLAALERCPLVADHTIDAVPVLPAAVAVGWALGAVEHAEGRPALRLRDFTVHKGIVFDGTQAEECRLVMTPGDGEVRVAVRSVAEDGSVRPHYAATVPAGAPEPAAPLTGLPAPGTGEDAAGLYDDGTLFHGPALRGLRRVLAAEESRLVLECEPVALDTATAAGSWYAAGPADLLLQAALVWVRRYRSAAGLPLAVGGVDLYAPLTAPGTFLVVVEPVEPVRHGGPDSRLTVTACTPDGRVLARFTDVSVVSAPQLAAKFAS